MKKYNKPAIKIVKIETIKMLAESIGISRTKVDAEDAEARGSNSVWEDEDY